MQVYLLRHGIAEDPIPGKPDSVRALTPEGKKKMRSIARKATASGLSFTLVLSSPYRRALETAEIMTSASDGAVETTKTNALLPHVHPREVWEELKANRDEQSVLLVGHDPQMSQLVGYLTGAPDLQIDFKKGALCRIDFEQFGVQPKGVLKWLVTPKLMG